MSWDVRGHDTCLEAVFQGAMILSRDQGGEIQVRKVFRLDRTGVQVDYHLSLAEDSMVVPLDSLWAATLGLGLTSRCSGRSGETSGHGAEHCEEMDLDVPWEMNGLGKVEFSCPYTQGRLVVEVLPRTQLRHVPLWAVTKSESGFERTPQGSAFYFLWPLRLLPGREECFRMTLRFAQD